MDKSSIIALLHKEMIPAMGCTEPAASALAGAKAREISENVRISKVTVYASRDMVKNAMGVGIPNCELKGILAAVALGICGGDTSKSLSILSKITQKQKEEASKLDTNLVLVENVPPLYVSVRIDGTDGSYSLATISGEHDRFSRVEKNGEVLVDKPLEEKKAESVENCADPLKIDLDDIVEFAESVETSDVPFVADAIKVNTEIAEYSINGSFGLQVGKTISNDVKDPTSLAEAFEKAAALAAAGSDARMSGCSMPVIINSGSGNQGITVTVPVSVVGKFLKKDERTIVRAVCISELVGLCLTARKNRLSALCGAFTASIGTACAYVYLLGGDRKMMDRAINTMVGNLTGIICDGAKNTCALKIYSCLECSALSVKLAQKGFSPGDESGIVGNNSLESITSLSRISSEGMMETDKTIISIMMDKHC